LFTWDERQARGGLEKVVKVEERYHKDSVISAPTVQNRQKVPVLT
jgi:hypothetical protein